MNYVEVLVGEASYHGEEALTYSAPRTLPRGTLVMVPLRNKEVVGVVVGTTQKPRFTVKSLNEISPLPVLPEPLLQMLDWMRTYYPAPLGIITQLFLPRALPKDISTVETHTTTKPTVLLPDLTKDQIEALASINKPGLHLLHGETGSGKTRVYVELAKKQMKKGKSSLILTPEIGLTSQLVNDFRSVFGGEQIALIHSELTDVTRRKTWLNLLTAKKPLIVIGARSALFSPIKELGLIVVDESHETAYKQDQAPHYHASSVAAKLAGLHEAQLILGSATPLVTDYFIAKAKERPIVRMCQTASQTANDAEHSVHVVDLRNKQLFSKSPFISNDLIDATESRLKTGEQVLLFLNRRGTARMVFCEQCGWQALCPHCDLPLVYHGDTHSMRCHTCNYRASSPVGCPTCNNPTIVFTSIGTKALESEVHRLFPEAKTQRFDTDNKRAERIEAHYDSVRKGDVDILVGTQTLAKGLDLPKLGLVGVITADTGLSFPDFSAQERTFQLVSQVLGRVGRGHRSTKAIIQTYAPDSSILAAVLSKKWDTFYNKELDERRQFLFPPYCYLLKLTCRRATKNAAERTANDVVKTIVARHSNVVVEGPVPSFHERIQNKYQWQIVIKAKQRRALLDIIHELPANWFYDIDPLNLL